MWSTADGHRVLRGKEADLVRLAMGQMLICLVAEIEEDSLPRRYGVDWFDQWDADQRIWLLEQVAAALFLEHQPPPSPAAMFEATVDAIFCQLVVTIREEIDAANRPGSEAVWRQAMVEAFQCQSGKLPQIDSTETDIHCWYLLSGQLADSILGHSSYQQAEGFRDGDASNTRRFLEQRALPEDYLQRIPPLRSEAETRSSLRVIGDILKL